MQTFLWDSVLLRNHFSSAGIAQYRRDVDAICDVFDRFVGKGQANLGMRKLREGLELLGMPIKAKTQDGGEQESSDDGALGDKRPGIWEVEKRVFRSNESAREMLEELGMDALTESEARHVLERRVELGS